ncbi:hypothetical protein BZG36_01636 [Bifiguratus adelaidae]|uniref:Transcriptional regulatory protein RXT2 N-terminal domain-containing protein n=1 Tax=Bifiguratus adelaidae TaxID=1938954 RepID=A0A261Y484_9FUNG|nr:hypothetical protein BZG36_01636 [Bifiguratus adelaidae]
MASHKFNFPRRSSSDTMQAYPAEDDPMAYAQPSQAYVTATKLLPDGESDGSDADSVGLVPHNRGHKLKRWATSESVGGSRLRNPASMAHEVEVTKGGKKRKVLKKKRKVVADWSDDEDDPYNDIKVEEILNPIESATEVIRRPSLRRILKSKKMEFLSDTAMDFIESEKAFNKVLSRLAYILQYDDPHYLDISYERKIQHVAPTMNGGTSDKINVENGNHPSGQKGEDSSESRQEEDSVRSEMQEQDALTENINCSKEYLNRLFNAREKLAKAIMQRDELYKQLKSRGAEQQRRERANQWSKHGDGMNGRDEYD